MSETKEWIKIDFQAYYLDKDKTYYLRGKNGWVAHTDKSFLRRLEFDNTVKESKTTYNNYAAKKAICVIERDHSIDAVSDISGYTSGVHIIGGMKVLVKNEPKVVQAKKGEFPFIEAYLNLLSRDCPIQKDVLKSWLKRAVEKWTYRQHGPLQMLTFAGPANTGKSLGHEITRTLLGGYTADPYDYLTGRTQFNHDLIVNNLWTYEDRPAIEPKRQLSYCENVKHCVMSDFLKDRGLFKDGLSVDPIRFMQASMNLEMNNVSFVPPAENGYRDKFIFMLFTVKEFPMKGFEKEGQDRTAAKKRIASEISAFAFHLLKEYKIPEELLTRVHGAVGETECNRYGMDSWWHPDIATLAMEKSPTFNTIQIFDAVMELKNEGKAIVGVAKDISTMLEGYAEEVAGAFELGSDVKKLGFKLRDASMSFPARVKTVKRGSKGNIWRIEPPMMNLKEAEEEECVLTTA